MSQVTRRAIYGKMAGDTTLIAMLAAAPTGYAKSIFYEQAPEGAAFPFVVFSKQSGTPDYSLRLGSTLNTDVWLIKGIARGSDSGDALEAVDNISARLDALLTDGTITVSGATPLYLRRDSDVDYSETVDGVTYRHAGSLFRLVYQA